VLFGCGSGSGGETSGGDHRLIAAIGDSITAGYPGYAPDRAQFDQEGVRRNPESQWEWWAQKEHPDLEFRNCGVRGQRTDEIAQRFDSCTQGADGVVIQGGINDLREGIPARTALANLRGMIHMAKQLNLHVAIADLLPLNVDHRADPSIQHLNSEIHRIAREEGVTLLPFHDVLEDPHAPDRMPGSWTADGIHPSVEGYRRLGELGFKPPGD
jgi:lysophospholipase L1-like esterase